MNGWIIAGALVVIGLLVALVVFGAMMLSKMSTMCCTSEEIAANAKDTQAKLEAANAKLAAVLAPLAAQAAAQQASAQAAQAAQQQQPSQS